ncbi:MAG TPA: gliding motility-associated ABC transporter substrate-binding protein GldG, partial [Chitinophagaceae bacterium]|nr:gliding motility-associated ABC transporter substrate-binding protein GldG [Chitinophagaceae bacterium]
SFHQRIDLTEEKRYSLTKATKDILYKVDDELVINVFLKGDFPAGFRKLSNTTREFVQVLKESNPANIQYNFISPEDEVENGGGKSWGDSLTAAGVAPINLTVQVKSGQENKLVFPVALITYKGQTDLVNLYPSSQRVVSPEDLNNAEAAMEYGFANTIAKLQNPVKPFVAYATGNGEPVGAETYDLQRSLSNNYNLFTFDLKLQKNIPDTIKALLIVKPTIPFADAEKLKIDQYIMRGGKVIWAIDNLNAEQDSLSYKTQLIAFDRNLNIDDQLFRYGVRINPDLIMDLQCDFLPFAVGGDPSNPQYEFLHWNYYPLFESRRNHMINKNLGLVAGRFVNSLDTVEVSGIKKTLLLQSSANARIISTPALISPNENRNVPQDRLFTQKDIPAAVLLEVKFISLYKNRISKAQNDSLAANGGFKESGEAQNKMVVIADGDLLLNDVSQKSGPLPMGMNSFTVGSQYEYAFANRDFLLNTVEYMVSNTTIMEVRNKEVVLRLLDKQKVEDEKTKWQFINIALPILLVILFGFIYQQLRKRKYAV